MLKGALARQYRPRLPQSPGRTPQRTASPHATQTRHQSTHTRHVHLRHTGHTARRQVHPEHDFGRSYDLLCRLRGSCARQQEHDCGAQMTGRKMDSCHWTSPEERKSNYRPSTGLMARPMPADQPLHRRHEHVAVIVRRGQSRPGLVAVVCQRAFDDVVKLRGLHAHFSQTAG